MKLNTATALPALAICLATVQAVQLPDGISGSLQQLLQTNKSAYQYPTDLTRGIVPKAIHSHNDYWRDLPFYSALSYGAVSVEADVFSINGTLYIGHEISALTTARTFQSLYVQPILDVIKRQNPTTQFVNGSTTKNGVFDTNGGQTLYLWIDVKTAGDTTWPVVLRELLPLYQAGYLTTTNGKTVTQSLVTVIGTGNTPLSYFSPVDPANTTNPRYTFYDAPLATLNQTNVTAVISPIASTAFSASIGEVKNQTLNATQLATLRSQVGFAKSRGIGARYWDQPGWPIGTRNAVWRTLLDEGVSLINVDDLAGAAGFWQNKG